MLNKFYSWIRPCIYAHGYGAGNRRIIQMYPIRGLIYYVFRKPILRLFVRMPAHAA